MKIKARVCLVLALTLAAVALTGCKPLAPQPQESSSPVPSAPAVVIDAAPPGDGMPTILDDYANVVFVVYDASGKSIRHAAHVVITATAVDPQDPAFITDPITGYRIPSPDILPLVYTPFAFPSHLAPDIAEINFTVEATVTEPAKLSCWVERNGQIVPGSVVADTGNSGIAVLSVSCTHRRGSA